MESRVAAIGIVVEDATEVARLNEILHEFAHRIVGRMGVPYRQRGINVIMVAIDAPANEINTLCGRLGALSGVNVKVAYSSTVFED